MIIIRLEPKKLTFGTPGEIALIQSKGTELFIATPCPDCMDSFGTKL